MATHSLAGRVKYVILLFQDFIEPHNRGGSSSVRMLYGNLMIKDKGQDFEQSFHNLWVKLTGYKNLGNAKVKLRRYKIPGK